MREHEEFKIINQEEAQMLLDYMEGHDYRVSTDKDENLIKVDVGEESGKEQIEISLDGFRKK